MWLASGDLWCHLPKVLTPALQAEIDDLGPVCHLVAPNKIHYVHIPAWARAYPEAIAWAAPGVGDRAARQAQPIVFQANLGDSPPPAWATEIDQCIVRGSRFMEEVVFFHRPSRTLILTDLIENFEPDGASPWLRCLLCLRGNVDPDGKTPHDLQLTFWGCKQQARASLQQMLAWQPDRILLAHGRWYDQNAVAELRRAFRWLAEGWLPQ